MTRCSLLPGLLDYIVSFLRRDKRALCQCCLVSKPWVPRARKHLFALVQFRSPDDIDKWKKTFPDSSSSPVRYTRTLMLNCFEVVTAADAAEAGWIPTFSGVVHLYLDNFLTSIPSHSEISLTPFYKFSSTLKQLFVASSVLPRLRVFNLIYSLPLLEDLSLIGDDTSTDDGESDESRAVVPPHASPKFTGILQLLLFGGMAASTRQLVRAPRGIHFRIVKLSWSKEEDLRSIEELIVVCSATLEHLDITHQVKGRTYSLHSFARPLTSIYR